MSNKFTAEFDREELKEICDNNRYYYRWSFCKTCPRADKNLLSCVLKVGLKFNIKEQNNENKREEIKKLAEIENLKERIEKLKFQRDYMCIDGYQKPFYTKKIIELTKKLEEKMKQ